MTKNGKPLDFRRLKNKSAEKWQIKKKINKKINNKITRLLSFITQHHIPPHIGAQGSANCPPAYQWLASKGGLLTSRESTVGVPRIRPSVADKSLGTKGLVSADRSEDAALLCTTPRSIPKSSASDFAPLSTAECYPRSRATELVLSGPRVRGIRPRP